MEGRETGRERQGGKRDGRSVYTPRIARPMVQEEMEVWESNSSLGISWRELGTSWGLYGQPVGSGRNDSYGMEVECPARGHSKLVGTGREDSYGASAMVHQELHGRSWDVQLGAMVHQKLHGRIPGKQGSKEGVEGHTGVKACPRQVWGNRTFASTPGATPVELEPRGCTLLPQYPQTELISWSQIKVQPPLITVETRKMPETLVIPI